MAISISTGATVAIASTYGAAVNMTAITNANPAVATLAAAHGVVVGEFVEVTTSGWGRIQGRLFRVSAVSTNDVTLEGLNTTSTAAYPALGGTGTVRRITACQENVLSQLDDMPALDALMKDIGASSIEELSRRAANIHVALPVSGSDTGDYMGTLADWFPEVSRDDEVSLPWCPRPWVRSHQLGCSQALVSKDRLLETPNELLQFVRSSRRGPMQTPFLGVRSATAILARTETHAAAPFAAFAAQS